MITDSQVRIAFKVYMQDEDYEPSLAGMRDMRTALEAASVNGPWATAVAGGGWCITRWTLDHATHGTFFISRTTNLAELRASRVFADSSKENGLDCHTIGQDFATLEDAQAAVANHIAELDAQVAAPAQVSEQLEACR